MNQRSASSVADEVRPTAADSNPNSANRTARRSHVSVSSNKRPSVNVSSSNKIKQGMFRRAVPQMPRVLASFCFVLNLILPGTGSIWTKKVISLLITLRFGENSILRVSTRLTCSNEKRRESKKKGKNNFRSSSLIELVNEREIFSRKPTDHSCWQYRPSTSSACHLMRIFEFFNIFFCLSDSNYLKINERARFSLWNKPDALI